MINRYMALLLEELAGEGIPNPLGEPFTLAALWDDLARLAGERPPAAVRRLHDAAGVSITPHDQREVSHPASFARPGRPA